MIKSKEFKRIYIEITNICNLSCSFCPTLSRAPHRMTTKEFEHILKEISPYTDYVYLHVKGEPLIHPDIEDILALCDKYHMYANITTNGTLIESRKEILYHAKALRQVNISLHSFEDPIILKETEESAGAGGYFESSSQTIMNTDISQAEQSLIHYLQPIVEAAKYFSAHTDTITALRLWNLDSANMDASSRSKNRMVISYLENAFEVAINPSELSRGIKLGNRIFLNQDYEFTWPSMSADYVGDTGSCYGLDSQLGILSNGTVIPCCLDSEGDIALGNIFTQSMDTILSSERVSCIRSGFQNRIVVEDLCKRCGYRSRFGR